MSFAMLEEDAVTKRPVRHPGLHRGFTLCLHDSFTPACRMLPCAGYYQLYVVYFQL